MCVGVVVMVCGWAEGVYVCVLHIYIIPFAHSRALATHSSLSLAALASVCSSLRWE